MSSNWVISRQHVNPIAYFAQALPSSFKECSCPLIDLSNAFGQSSRWGWACLQALCLRRDLGWGHWLTQETKWRPATSPRRSLSLRFQLSPKKWLLRYPCRAPSQNTIDSTETRPHSARRQGYPKFCWSYSDSRNRFDSYQSHSLTRRCLWTLCCWSFWVIFWERRCSSDNSMKLLGLIAYLIVQMIIHFMIKSS